VKKWKKCFISKSMSSVYLYITIFSILLSGYAVALAQTNSSNKTYTGNPIQERVLENEGNPGKGFERTQSAQESLNVKNRENETPESLEEKASYTWVVVSQVWHYEIAKIEGNPITVGNIIIALLLLVMGFLLSKRLATQIKKQLIERFKLDEASAVISQQIMYYLLLVLLVLFVLNFAGIPLTFFAVLGGAAAIGVGFGSQTIVNNFLSGLILMMERHIKIGDIVEVENILGIVEWVGTRSTIIKTFDNVRLVLPNGTLLQSQVVNWSLADDIVRREILVGVRYGSSVREVENLLKQAVNEHNLVEEHPQPVVLFEDFGENALVFSVLIWVRMYRTGKSNLYIRQVESDIRFRIDELFRQNDIVIAFPQRDIHIDTLKPLEVKVTQE
jgi:potassium efflux system protein